MTRWFYFLASFCSFLPTALQVTTCIWPKLFVWSRMTESYVHAKNFPPTRHRCWDMTHEIRKKMPKIDHFVIAPTLKYIACVLEWLQYEIDSITWKIKFRRWKSFGRFAERNDGYDDFFEKKNKIFQKLSFDCRIHIWHLFCPVFLQNFSHYKVCSKFNIFCGMKFWSFL